MFTYFWWTKVKQIGSRMHRSINFNLQIFGWSPQGTGWSGLWREVRMPRKLSSTGFFRIERSGYVLVMLLPLSWLTKVYRGKPDDDVFWTIVEKIYWFHFWKIGHQPPPASWVGDEGDGCCTAVQNPSLSCLTKVYLGDPDGDVFWTILRDLIRCAAAVAFIPNSRSWWWLVPNFPRTKPINLLNKDSSITK